MLKNHIPVKCKTKLLQQHIVPWTVRQKRITLKSILNNIPEDRLGAKTEN